MKSVEAIKAYVTYGITAFVVVAGMIAIYQLRQLEGASDTVAIFAGFVGGALAFLYGQEVQTRTARQSQAATLAGVTGTNGHDQGIDGSPPVA